MFSKIFGKKKKAERPSLTHAKDLRVGDLFEMGLCPIAELSGKNFTVLEANTLDYGEGVETAFIITSDRQKYGLSIAENDQGEKLSFSKLIQREQVAAVFGLEAFGAIFEEGTAGDYRVQEHPTDLANWLDEKCYYKTIDALKGYFEKGDHRFGQNKSRAEEFDYYELEGSNNDFGLEIEVYEGDETEVYLSRSLPLHTIDRFWPQDAKEEES